MIFALFARSHSVPYMWMYSGWFTPSRRQEQPIPSWLWNNGPQLFALPPLLIIRGVTVWRSLHVFHEDGDDVVLFPLAHPGHISCVLSGLWIRPSRGGGTCYWRRNGLDLPVATAWRLLGSELTDVGTCDWFYLIQTCDVFSENKMLKYSYTTLSLWPMSPTLPIKLKETTWKV